MELNELIEEYKSVRSAKERYEVFYKTKLADIQEKIDATLIRQGLQSAKTDAGQAIRYVRRSVRIGDLEMLSDYAQAHAPQLLKTTIDSSEALALIDDGVAIPGVEVNSTFVLSVK